MQPGHLVLVCYGEVPPVWHVRLLLAAVQNTECVILTPDYDRYIERLDHLNTDFTGFEYLGAPQLMFQLGKFVVSKICLLNFWHNRCKLEEWRLMQSGPIEVFLHMPLQLNPNHLRLQLVPYHPTTTSFARHVGCCSGGCSSCGSLASSSSWSDSGGELLGGCGRCWRATKG